MRKDLLEDLGENYEYVRTIVNNKIELAKLELIEDTGKLASTLVLAIVLLVLGYLIFCGLLILLGILLTRWTESLIAGVGIVTALLAISSFCIFYFRELLIVQPTLNKFYDLMKDRIDGSNEDE